MQITPAYQSALDYIFSYVDYSKTHAANLAPENFDLRRMFDLLERLKNPHTTYPSIHIAGTKGKGSTAAFCSSALNSAGYKTGLYTSPHLEDFSERIRINGIPVRQGDVVELLERIKPHIESVPGISTFEIMTALAFCHFADEHVDVAVLEVGLGGRLDATNVIVPLVSVITSISMDHVPILGSNIAAIAAEKAGIIKPGIPVVTAPQRPEALRTILQIADERRVPVQVVGNDVEFRAVSHSFDSQSFEIRTRKSLWHELSTPLLGAHQVENAATAWTALQEVRRKGLVISEADIRRGFSEVRWPGRFEFLRREPYVVLDAAHNEDSARRLVETLDAYFSGRRMTVIIGASGDKAVEAFLRAMKPRVTRLIVTRSEHPRAMSPGILGQIAVDLGMEPVVTENIEAAMRSGLNGLGPEDVVLVTGSVFVVGAARAVWGRVETDL